MGVKKCSIENCNSSSSRPEDIGVTYHKYPKDTEICETWLSATHYNSNNIDNSTYVCSRHFCKSDFKVYQDTKYALKSDAVPSIFSWNPIIKSEKMETIESNQESNSTEQTHNTSSSSKESEEENVEIIKQYIDKQEIEKHNKKNEEDAQAKAEMNDKQKSETPENSEVIENQGRKENQESREQANVIERAENVMLHRSIMDMILSESENKADSKKEIKPIPKQSLSPKGNSIALSVGSKVEAKDFAEIWYPAEILEVDYDEMEVLVHYENVSNKHDEWINISSPRLRPITKMSTPVTPVVETPAVIEVAATQEQVTAAETVPDIKPEDKPRLHFVVGERCLARWRDNRRFIATIANDLSNGVYEVIFDDGFHWKCNTSRLYKLKDPGKYSECLSVDTSMSPKQSTPSPVQAGAGPSTGVPPNPLNPAPIFHTHLFDPTRDYLGSKSERREMKRKLNIKEIFNIGQKKKKKETPPKEKVARVVKEKKPRVVLQKIKMEELVEVKTEIKTEVKTEIPDAVASIIGTVAKEEKPATPEIKMELDTEQSLDQTEEKEEIDNKKSEVQEGSDKITLDDLVDSNSVVSAEIEIPTDLDLPQSTLDMEPDMEEEQKLENFEKPDESKKEAIEKMKEVISKLEVGLNKLEEEHQNRVDSPKPEPSPKLEPKPEPVFEVIEVNPTSCEIDKVDKVEPQEKSKKKLAKIRKSKKLRLLQEKKVKKQVEKVKSELEEMKRQVEEMRKQMLFKTEQPSPAARPSEMPESFLLPGEWCCKWRDGQPVGAVSEIEGDPKMDANNKMALPRRSVQVEDKRLPPGWSKHMVRRRLGQSAGKWDVVLVSPTNHRFHTKNDMRNFLELNKSEELKPYEYALLDFGVHLKLSRRMGWYTSTGDGSSEPAVSAPLTTHTMSPLAKAKKYRVYRKDDRKEKKKTRKKQIAALRRQHASLATKAGTSGLVSFGAPEYEATPMEYPALEDGYVYVGSLKVQILENLLRCPAEGCYKNFRNNTLLQMHIKHYHRELRKMLGATPKVLDLAQQRTLPTDLEPIRQPDSRILKIKISRPPKRIEEPKLEPKVSTPEINVDIETITPTKTDMPIPRSQDSPKLRQALANKPVKRPKVLLPVRRPDPEPVPEDVEEESLSLVYDDDTTESTMEIIEPQDFETAISTHTVTKPIDVFGKKAEKKRKYFSTVPKKTGSEDDEWYGMNSDVETRSSFPGSGTPDSKTMDKGMSHQQAVSSESTEDQKDPNNTYMFTETGERIKIEHMKREEIINCHCGLREEDGLMVQCELCLCWQHALCHNIQKESEVPEKYTCSICLNPKRGRRSKRFLHDQDRLYEGLLPGAKPCESLRRSHELSGNLLRIQDALHAMRVKYYVATKKDHPKLYLWAKDWENAEVNFTQQRLNSDYSDLNIIINNIGKENLPVKHEDVHLDLRTSLADDLDHDRFSHRDSASSLLNLTAALSSPGGTSLDLPITTSELERLAKSVQEQEVRNVCVPQPEAAIENGACRERLLRHVQRCQALIDARLDSIEAQVAELESQDPSFEDDETADYFPRTKQTVQMLMRDLDTMEELGIIT